jgi:thiamine monophosphate synthase
MPMFKESIDRLQKFDCIGVSVHSQEEAIFALDNGSSYIVYSHIFPTDCKKGLKPKGVTNLKKVCETVEIPVYALGEINSENESLVVSAGASGVCQMSEYMQIIT